MLLPAGPVFSAGPAIAFTLPTTFALGGWFTAVVLLVFAFIGRSVTLRQSGSGDLRSEDVVADRG
jgi:hypothetical protein